MRVWDYLVWGTQSVSPARVGLDRLGWLMPGAELTSYVLSIFDQKPLSHQASLVLHSDTGQLPNPVRESTYAMARVDQYIINSGG